MYYIYILANQNNSILYIGVTNDLSRRLYEHKSETADSFTKRYHVNKLVYFEEYSSNMDAISREKQLKKWKQEKKDKLISSINPDWDDWSVAFY